MTGVVSIYLLSLGLLGAMLAVLATLDVLKRT